MTSASPIPDDDPTRELVVTDRDDPAVPQLFLVGDVYSVLLTGEQTNGRYCLIDMQVPDGGGPPLHRHDFEEMFTVLEGEITFVFRGERTTARAGTTVNIPANAPHHFTNESGADARMLCMCTPAIQEEYFLEVADRLPSRMATPPQLSEDEVAARGRHAAELAPSYATQMLV